MKRRASLLSFLLCAALLLFAFRAAQDSADSPAEIPGLAAKERVLLRIWVVDAPGGGQAWLKEQLRLFEKQHKGVSTYLRQVSAEELAAPDALLPDIVLYQAGSIAEPQTVFLPLSGEAAASDGILWEALLRCGRHQGRQYGLPLCWGAWVLALDGALEPESIATPAPTTLLGRAAATDVPSATATPGYPLAAVRETACALQSPGGAALFTLGLLLEESPPLPDDFATLTSSETYSAFQKRQCVTAMLTTGQATAFSSLVSSAGGFSFRIMTADEIITDQVWLGSITADAPDEAALLLSYLTGRDAQKALSAQGLYSARADLALYASGFSAQVEQAARKGLAAVNAYLPAESIQNAAWQFFQGQLSLDEALTPLL